MATGENQGSPDRDVDLPPIGREIRALRHVRGMTIAELAAASGLSESFVSQVERDVSNLSVAALVKIARALSVKPSWFLEADREDDGRIAVRATQRRVLRHAKGMIDEVLSPALDLGFVLLLSRFAPGASQEARASKTGEQAGYVLEGSLDLTLEGRTIRIRSGDSFHLKLLSQVTFSNPGDTEAVVVWVATSPYI